MNEQVYDNEVDIKKLLYRAVREWRKIVVWAIILSLIAGAFTFIRSVISINNPENEAAKQNEYQYQLAAYNANGLIFNNEIDNLNENRKRQSDYNENSVLMKINPMLVSKATMNLYIDTGYQIAPDKTYQSTDPSNRIVQAYYRYITGGEMYKNLIELLPYEIELRYLKELISCTVDYSTSMIYIEITHIDEKSCNEIISLIYQGLVSAGEGFQSSIAEHTINTTNSVAYSVVDFDLDAKQKENLQYIADIDTTLQEKSEAFQEWKETAKPTYEFSYFELFKGAVKITLIAGLVIVFLFMLIIVCVYMMSDKLQDADEIRKRYGIRVIGALPRKTKKKAFSFIDRLFTNLGGVVIREDEYDKLLSTITASIRTELDLNKDLTQTTKSISVAFTGTISKDEMRLLLDGIQLGSDYIVVNAGDIVTDADSVVLASTADYIIMVEKQEASIRTQIEKELEQMMAWKKNLLGAIVINADASK